MVSTADVRDDEARKVMFVDWIQYWSPAILERWGIEMLRRGPFARVDALANGAAGVWLVRDPLTEPMSRAAAAAYLGVSLPRIYRRDHTLGHWLAVPWP